MAPSRASIRLLRQVPIFSSLTDGELQRIIDSPENEVVRFRPLQPIIQENEIGDCMYIILDGSVDVRIRAVGGREITIATLKTGEFFGEQALLPGASGKRNASVRALQQSDLFKISKSDVVLGMSHDEELGPLADDLAKASEADRVKMLIRSVRLFRSLSPKDLDRIDDWTEVVRFAAGEIIVREKEQGDFMYIVLEGTVEVFVVDDDGKVVVIARLPRGNYFGEQALLPDGEARRNANVRANDDVILVRVAKRYFQLIVNHDRKLMLALKAVGEEQRKKIISAIGDSQY